MNLAPLLRRLAGLVDDDGRVVTLALDVSKAGLPPAARVFLKKRVLKELKDREALRKTANRIEAYVTGALPPAANGLFLVAAPGTWEAVELEAPLRNLLHVGRSPFLAPLLELEDRAPRALVAVSDGRAIRLIETYLGESSDLGGPALETPDPDAERRLSMRQARLPASGGSAGARGSAARDRFRDTLAEAGNALLRVAAREIARRRASDLVFFGTREAFGALRDRLPAELSKRAILAGAPPRKDDLLARKTAQALEEAAARRRREEVRALLDRRRQGHLVSLGPRHVFQRLGDGTAARVFLDPDDPLPGTACEDCGTRFPDLRPRCGLCGGALRSVSLAQEVVAHRLSHPELGLTFVTPPAPWLKEAGGMAALLGGWAARKR